LQITVRELFKYMSKRYQDPLTEIRKPALRAPADSCDCHAHMFGPLTEYPVIADARFSNPRVGADDYRKIADCLGIARTVIVQPHVYGADNRCAWDILEQQQGKWSDIAVLDLSENERTLTAMHVAVFRGMRVNLRNKGGLTMPALAEVAARIKPTAGTSSSPSTATISSPSRKTREASPDQVSRTPWRAALGRQGSTA